MKKIAVGSLLCFVITLAPCVQAQGFFRGVVRGPRSVKTTVKPVRPRVDLPVATRLPAKPVRVRGGVATPYGTRKSHTSTVSKSPRIRVERRVTQAAQAAQRVKPFVGQAVYTGVADLAHDVAVFYEGKGGQRVIDPFGREFVLYELPQDVVYEPFGKTPQVLSARTHVILYNRERNAGDLLAKDAPELKRYTPAEE